jgi:NAD(P)H dehydrogenase (quinone)
MNCLIVRAHPLEENLTRRFSDFASGRLEATGHKVSLIDLYAEDFDPRLTAAERASYYADKYDRSGMERHIDALRAAETLVLAFPTWWFGPPAIMKGWLDRVMAPGVAFDHGRDFGPIEPKLLGLRHVVTITTLGSPWWVDRLVLRRPVRRVLKTAVFGGCAPNARFTYLPFYRAETATADRIARFETRIARTIGG